MPLFLGSLAGLELNRHTVTENPPLPGTKGLTFEKVKSHPVIMQRIYKVSPVLNDATQGIVKAKFAEAPHGNMALALQPDGMLGSLGDFYFIIFKI